MDNVAIFCVAVPIVAIVVIFVASSRSRASREKALREASAAYQAALEQLKEQPSDPSRRQLALEAGRYYSGLTRESKGVTVFDEIALKNDLDAASAGAALRAAPPAPGPVTSVADRLRQLDDLKAQGLVSDEEYQARRAKVLEGV